ncbi:unnamed protein product [Gongylonema pulchrum]|uniref:Uncharacterized protein n=1 Tax=Gongylonema pulchrum TaxID=637853 RepID=A0A183DNV8_9BILA|nr:unnamed protein product [Gongylonema pulchrum]
MCEPASIKELRHVLCVQAREMFKLQHRSYIPVQAIILHDGTLPKRRTASTSLVRSTVDFLCTKYSAWLQRSGELI